MVREDAQAILASTQQLRTHWSGVITSHFGLALTINVAIWSYFIVAYISSKNGSIDSSLFILSASAISSVLLGLWRIYTRHIDDHIAHLYPDLLLCEEILGLPSGRGTSGYLAKAIPNVKALVESREVSIEGKLEGFEKLLSAKRAGDRGHQKIDQFALLVIVAMTILSVILISSNTENYHKYFLIGNLVGLIFIYISLTKFHGNPDPYYIKRIITEVSTINNDHKNKHNK